MSDYREQSNLAKAQKRGIVDPKPPHANRKKPKVRGPWKVIGMLFGKERVFHDCLTEELAQKMVRKHAKPERYRIEYQGGRNE